MLRNFVNSISNFAILFYTLRQLSDKFCPKFYIKCARWNFVQIAYRHLHPKFTLHSPKIQEKILILPSNFYLTIEPFSSLNKTAQNPIVLIKIFNKNYYKPPAAHRGLFPSSWATKCCSRTWHCYFSRNADAFLPTRDLPAHQTWPVVTSTTACIVFPAITPLKLHINSSAPPKYIFSPIPNQEKIRKRKKTIHKKSQNKSRKRTKILQNFTNGNRKSRLIGKPNFFAK